MSVFSSASSTTHHLRQDNRPPAMRPADSLRRLAATPAVVGIVSLVTTAGSALLFGAMILPLLLDAVRAAIVYASQALVSQIIPAPRA